MGFMFIYGQLFTNIFILAVFINLSGVMAIRVQINVFGRTQCVPTDGTGVLCQSYGLLIWMYYVLSRGLRHLPNVCRPYGVLLAFLSPVVVKKMPVAF